jgi:non-heme Fe2+,alpha-ketoglutarate-dependent halogenase
MPLVTGGFGLAESEKDDFWRQGFTGPFASGLSRESALTLGNRYERIVEGRARHPLYGRYSQRDWHLAHEDLERLLVRDSIVSRVAALLGRDLLLWRSKVFHKPARGDAIGWHQEWGFFDGEEIGNSVPSLRPASADGGIWDVTVWIALDDVTHENGALQFAIGSHTTRYPWEPVSMTRSAFYEDPFRDLDKQEIVRRARTGELLLDIDTASWLDDFDVSGATGQEMVAYLESRFAALQAKYTSFTPAAEEIATVTMRAGDFVIFTERTMHGSPANQSDRRRTAVNCRVTRADSLIYPGRLDGSFMDGSNLDISAHSSILVSGTAVEPRNAWRLPLPARPA